MPPSPPKRGDDRWCIADVRFAHRPPTERHTWIEAPFNDNRAVWQHLMADDVWRIDYQMDPDADPATVSSEAQVRARLARQFGPGVDCEIVWVGPYAYRSQCLDRLRIGSVFFMGDTAKIVSPFGARGGNTGVADADNLAWKLSMVLRGLAPEALLDSYHEERHEAARAERAGHRAHGPFPAPGGRHRAHVSQCRAIGLARRYPFARQFVNTGRMAVANAYTQSGVCESTGGLSVQNVGFAWLDGSTGTVNELLQWADGDLLLLAFGDLNRDALQRLRALAQTAPVRCVQVLDATARADATEHVRDPHGHLQGACHVFGHAWALVRPDAYVAATGESIDATLVHAVARALGAAHQPETTA
jgi:3-(3-hydroxy-phenyl)propionate hydroxylase